MDRRSCGLGQAVDLPARPIRMASYVHLALQGWPVWLLRMAGQQAFLMSILPSCRAPGPRGIFHEKGQCVVPGHEGKCRRRKRYHPQLRDIDCLTARQPGAESTAAPRGGPDPSRQGLFECRKGRAHSPARSGFGASCARPRMPPRCNLRLSAGIASSRWRARRSSIRSGRSSGGLAT